MIKLLSFILLLFLTTKVFAVENNIELTFSNEDAKYWQYISDRTMGGISDGQAVLEQDGDIFFARLKGNVSTDNNGGFIQLRTTLTFTKLNKDIKNFKGVRLNVRGNGELYHVFIRTSETKSYSDFYFATFITSDKWETVELPFSEFKNRFSEKALDGSDLRTFAIVAYGRDFISDVSVSKIIFFY